MSSLLPGFEYDIFISYRHNDNLDSWVTEFVQNLEKELKATVKDPITIYFDKNPYDGLLEIHNVDKSLKEKLKCLIFIPILSQTYCDSKSFAWQHEFCAFNKLVNADPLGRDVNLSNGNVASRILPVKIHDLDEADRKTIEDEIGETLRAIEFFYKEPGVNRPLKSTDNKNDNQNKTDYRNQVNKVANAIKELVASIKNPVIRSQRVTERRQTKIESSRVKKSLVAIVLALLLLSVAGYFIYPTSSSIDEVVEINDRSLAVLPFVDMSPDKDHSPGSDQLSQYLFPWAMILTKENDGQWRILVYHFYLG